MGAIMENGLQEYQETMLAEISPLEAHSRELLEEAEHQLVTNNADLLAANSLKKAINTHAKIVKDMRLELTRPIDGLKNALLDKEREILAPAEQAKAEIGRKILAYQEGQDRRRQEEEKRVDDIASEILGNYKPGMTRRQVELAKERGKRYINELPAHDAANPVIRGALLTLSNNLTARLQDIEIEEQRSRKKKLEIDQEAIDAQKRANAAREKQIADEAAAAQREAARLERERPKSNIIELTEFEIVDENEVDRLLCSPDMRKIREYHKAFPDQEIKGVKIIKTKKVR